MDFHIGVIQTIWWINLTSFPGCTGARGKPEFKLYWGTGWSSSQHHREPWWRQTVARLVSSAQQGHLIALVGALWPEEPPKNLPPPPDEMQMCKGPQVHAQRLKTTTPLPLQQAKRKAQVQNICAAFPAPVSWLFVKHLHSGFNYNWRWKYNQKFEELRMRRKRWTKSGVVALVPVSSCKNF